MSSSRYWRFGMAYLAFVLLGGAILQSGIVSREASLVLAHTCLIVGMFVGAYWAARSTA